MTTIFETFQKLLALAPQTLYQVLSTDNSTCRLALTGTAILIKSSLPSFLQVQGMRQFFSVQCVLAQWCLFLIAMFGDIGFDHPGKYGLSFDHLIYLAIAYVVLSLAGLVASYDSYKLIGMILFDGVFHVVVFINTN